MTGPLKTRISRLEVRHGIGKRRVIMYEAPDDYPRADIDAFLREALGEIEPTATVFRLIQRRTGPPRIVSDGLS